MGIYNIKVQRNAD